MSIWNDSNPNEAIPTIEPRWTPINTQSPLPPPPPAPPSPTPDVEPAARGRRRSLGVVGLALVSAVSALAGAAIGVIATRDDNQMVTTGTLVTVEPTDGEEVSEATTQIGKIAAAVAPSVVTLTATTTSQMGEGESVGTGVIINSNGELLTNAHVVEGAKTVQVRLMNETEPVKGTVLASDPQNDLALVKINATGLTAAVFADSKKVRLGDPVVAIGYALNLDGGPSVTSGIVSAIGRTITTDSGALDRLIQTDAAISSGNSGGPLVNDKAQVVGINTAVARGDMGTAANNIGFAISTEEVLRVVETLRDQANGVERKQGFLGVGLTDRTDGGQGAVIANVEDGSPASKAGIEEGDVVLAINDVPITGRTGMIAVVRDAQPGDTITIKVERGGKTVTLSATLVERDTSND
ncbi:MAG: trypsin-like peptidase domain-containing protein [Acidobacteria bacterium]|nr:trypsin-like peptidase domain-containing protein [Acidobacteriota bacterium]